MIVHSYVRIDSRIRLESLKQDGAILKGLTPMWPLLVALLGGCAWAGAPVSYQALLDSYVGADGTVDYARWKRTGADVEALDRHLSTMLKNSPTDRPKLYASSAEQLGYWINLYNALVLREIIRRWPLTSVTEAGPKEFFKELKFPVGSRNLSLDDIEREIIRARFKDPRIHFAINCGARSCPLLSAKAFVGAQLESQLDAAAETFINQKANVEVDDQAKTVTLSAIFDWYRDDFLESARKRAPQAGLIDYLLPHSRPALASALQRAKAGGYRLVFRSYDWGVNERVAESTRGVGEAVPDLSFELLGGGAYRPSQARGKVLLIDFWASFCKPCRATFPWLEALKKKHQPELVVLGVSEDVDPAAAAAFVKAAGVTFAIGVDVKNVAAGPPFEVAALPVEILVDRKGVVRFRHEGIQKDELEVIAREVELLLRER